MTRYQAYTCFYAFCAGTITVCLFLLGAYALMGMWLAWLWRDVVSSA